MKIQKRFLAVFLLALSFVVQASHVTHAGTVVNFSGVVQRTDPGQVRVYPRTIFSFTDEVALPVPFSGTSQITLYNATTSQRLNYRLIDMGTRGRAAILNLSGSTQQVFAMCPSGQSSSSSHCVQFRVTKLG
ncbi:MAG: hypothetical protein ABJM29_14155 [Rhizobiaceae bacterium]